MSTPWPLSLSILLLLSQAILTTCQPSSAHHKIPDQPKHDLLDLPNLADLLEAWASLYFPTSPGVGIECKADSDEYQQQVAREPWALEMLDASGKLPDGVGIGNTYIVGSYEECVRIGTKEDNYQAPFRGKYCKGSIRFHISGGYDEQDMSLGGILGRIPGYQDQDNDDDIGSSVAGMDNDEDIGGSVAGAVGSSWRGITWGLCVPESCTAADVKNHTNTVLSSVSTRDVMIYTRFYDNSCLTIDHQPINLDKLDIIYITIISILATIIIISTAVDMWGLYSDFWLCRTHEKGQLDSTENSTQARKVLAAFSLYRNGKKILESGQGGKKAVTCLHGMRFISMTWVIYGHQSFNLFGKNIVAGTVMDVSKVKLKSILLEIDLHVVFSIRNLFIRKLG